MSIFGVAFIVMLILKIFGLISVSWWWVLLLPFILSLVANLICYWIAYILCG